MSFVDRVGAALVSPRAALAETDRGVGGSADVFKLLLLKFVCAEAKAIVAAFWTMAVVGVGDGFTTLLNRLAEAVGSDLVLILVGAVVVIAAAGKKRSPGRDFDLAATAWIPALILTTLASLVQALMDATWPAAVVQGVASAALFWMTVMIVLAVQTARRRSAA